MEDEMSFGSYEFSRVNKSSFADLQLVSQVSNPAGQQNLLEWALARKKWYAMYVVKYQGIVVTRIDVKNIHNGVYDLTIETNQNHRNLGHGQTAMSHIIEHLRQNHSACRVHATANVWNKPANAMCARTKLMLECTLTSFGQDTNGDPCDVNMYSVIF
jgi:RimJ/RimL family protein N-acetyltransferase